MNAKFYIHIVLVMIGYLEIATSNSGLVLIYAYKHQKINI